MTTAAQPQDRHTAVADNASLTLAAYSHDPAEYRELNLMLGLIEVDPNGSLIAANPWDADVSEPAQHSPKG
ncbi:hypothetical protein [Saccharopolyspora hattusasensis]|uniref:hypothetical protein n=1 Tax=Saccharopolyspora hattusasensis TaxID=1128679 RepID=UPI003D95A7FD